MADESVFRLIFSFFYDPYFRSTARKSASSIFKNFFILQYNAAFSKRYPVSQVDHPLDQKIPFKPEKVDLYAEFLNLFIRAMSFLLRNFGSQVKEDVKNALESIGILYGKAAEIYVKNFSTTKRPRYLKRFKFLIIHTFDPHLMCIPSLHVMVLIQTYTKFREILRKLGKEEAFLTQIEELRRNALAISEAVLYIKQHSINCISAAMYAMSRYDSSFHPEEAELFARDLFKDADSISYEDAQAIRNHIISLYHRFFDQKTSVWEEPLLEFLLINRRS